MFKKGDYIVTLIVTTWTNCAKNNYIFKQSKNYEKIYPCIDLSGSSSNGNDSLKFDKTGTLKDWRYATPIEIEEYESLGKPFDTGLLNSNNYEIY